MVKLSDVAQINPRCPKEIDREQLVSFVAMASASEDGKLLSEEIRVLDETKKGFTYFERGDVLLAKITPCFENGKCLRPNQISKTVGFGSTEFHVLRAKEEKLDSSYLFYMVWSKAFRFLGEHSMSGAAGQKRVGADYLKAYEIPLPPLDEQKRIAAILDKAGSVRRKRQQAIDLADDFLRSVFLDMFGDPIANNKKWNIMELGELAPNKGDMVDGPFGSSVNTKTDYIDDGEIPVIRTKNVSLSGKFITDDLKFMTREKYETIIRSNVVPGDIVLTKVGTIGNVCIFPQDFQEAVLSTTGSCRIRVDESRINKTYLYYFLKYYRPKMHEIASAGVQPFLNMKHIKGFKVPMPDKELQERFADVVNRTTGSKTLLNESSKFKLFESLSQKAFAGEL